MPRSILGEVYFSANEVGAALDMSAQAVLRGIRLGRLPARKFGREMLIRPADLAKTFGLTPGEMAILRLSCEPAEPAPAEPAAL